MVLLKSEHLSPTQYHKPEKFSFLLNSSITFLRCNVHKIVTTYNSLNIKTNTKIKLPREASECFVCALAALIVIDKTHVQKREIIFYGKHTRITTLSLVKLSYIRVHIHKWVIVLRNRYKWIMALNSPMHVYRGNIRNPEKKNHYADGSVFTINKICKMRNIEKFGVYYTDTYLVLGCFKSVFGTCLS